MPIPEDLEERPLLNYYRDDDQTKYWVQDGNVRYRNYPIRGADPATFVWYLGNFAKDKKNCYCTSSKLLGAIPETFRALNRTYVTDGQSVWTMGGKIKDADATTFEVCDDGRHSLGSGHFAPYGYGKDCSKVYYYDFDGKPNWVRKALPGSFVSFNDGSFGKDENFVFCGASTLPKANVTTWQKIGGNYSRDDARIFYFNRQIPDADLDTFSVIRTRNYIQLAKDKNRCYWNDNVITEIEFARKIEKYQT